MKRMITGIIIGLLAGMVIGVLVAFFISPSLMFREDKYQKDFDTTVAKLEEAVIAKGWSNP